MALRELTMDVLRSFQRHGLANFASAMAFQAILALVPFLLFVLALLGFLDLKEVWRQDLAPDVRDAVSQPVFRVIDDSVTQVLRHQRGWWLTAGLALTVWELSGAMRVTMTALDRVYGYGRGRTLLQLLPRSLVLGTAMGLSVVGAVAVVRFTPLLIDDVHGLVAVLSFVVRWLLAAGVLAIGVGLTVRYGPARPQSLPWATFGTGVVLLAWVVTSIAFGVYVTYIASYQTVFGHLATFFILLIYVWLLANAFLIGIQLDACVRKRS